MSKIEVNSQKTPICHTFPYIRINTNTIWRGVISLLLRVYADATLVLGKKETEKATSARGCVCAWRGKLDADVSTERGRYRDDWASSPSESAAAEANIVTRRGGWKIYIKGVRIKRCFCFKVGFRCAQGNIRGYSRGNFFYLSYYCESRIFFCLFFMKRHFFKRLITGECNAQRKVIHM